MLDVDFEKWPCPLSLFTGFHVNFKMFPCRMLILRNTLYRVFYLLPRVARLYVACRILQMAMSLVTILAISM